MLTEIGFILGLSAVALALALAARAVF